MVWYNFRKKHKLEERWEHLSITLVLHLAIEVYLLMGSFSRIKWILHKHWTASYRISHLDSLIKLQIPGWIFSGVSNIFFLASWTGNTLIAKIQTNKQNEPSSVKEVYTHVKIVRVMCSIPYRGIFLHVFGCNFKLSFSSAKGDCTPTLSGRSTSSRTLFWIPFGDAAGQTSREEKCSGVLVIFLVVNKLLYMLTLPQEEAGVVTAHLTVFAILTKGLLLDTKHLWKRKFTKYILNPDHAVICHYPGLSTRCSSFLAPCRKALSWPAQLQQNLQIFIF